jgi:hypothetical protein
MPASRSCATPARAEEMLSYFKVVRDRAQRALALAYNKGRRLHRADHDAADELRVACETPSRARSLATHV